MLCADDKWDVLLKKAKAQQQEYYELLPQWTRYEEEHYKYLKQNIGFALFGPPLELTEECEVSDTFDVTNVVNYPPEAQKIIETVYQKICTFGKISNNISSSDKPITKDVILFEVIYNVTFCTKQDLAKGTDMDVCPNPIFKTITQSKTSKVLYIDMQGRVYQTWMDYLKGNTLPRCTMVVPKNGIYQPDKNFSITEECSTVWVDVMESPSCSSWAQALNITDRVVSVAGIVGIGLSVASLFTPAAPIVIGATVISGVNGVWVIGRSASNLWDKISHEESINPMERNALGLWLAIGGGVFGLASTGGTVYLKKLIENGATINNVARVTYNSLLLGNLGINFIGVGYQAFCIYEKYMEQEISVVDIVNLASHILFLSNAVVNLQFAGDLIETTQGKILDDYRATLRSKHLRRQFNRAKRNAAANTMDKISENAEVIRFIKRKAELNVQSNSGTISALKNNVKFQNGKIIIGSITLLDPMKFVDILINFDKRNSSRQYSSESNSSKGLSNGKSERVFAELKDLLRTLLDQLYSKNDKAKCSSSIINNFDRTFNDMKFMEHGTSVFLLIFKVSIKLINLCFGSEPFVSTVLEKSVHFIWSYVKESLKSTCSQTFSIFGKAAQTQIDEIILHLFNHMEATVTQLKPAFKKYMAYYGMA